MTTDVGVWWANCAWDSLAMLAALHSDGRIESTWSDTLKPAHLGITDGQLDTSGFLDAGGGSSSRASADAW